MNTIKEAAKLIIKAAGKRGLWDNIHAKREIGEKPAKPGDKDYPDSKSWNATVKAGAVDKLISMLATGRLKKAALKKAWEVGDDTGWYSDSPLRYASRLTASPRFSGDQRDREAIDLTLRQAVKNLPIGQKLHWTDPDAVVGGRSWFNPQRYLFGKQIIDEKNYELDQNSDDNLRADIVQKILDNYAGQNTLLAHRPARYYADNEDHTKDTATDSSKKAAVTDIDPKLLKILRSQLGKGSFTPDTPWSNHGDDLDLVETIMEYEAQNAGDVNDADLGFYADKPDRYGFRTVRPDLTFGQIQEGLHRSFKPSVAAILGKKAATAAWTRAEGKSESGGLNAKGRASLKAQGHDIKPPVTEDNPTGEDAERKKGFCARMKGMKRKRTSAETARDPDSRINKSLRKWKC